MDKLEGKNAVITGSDSGIGRAIAIEFANNGANVVICYHSDETGAREAASKVEAAGQKAIIVKVDVGAETEVDNLFDIAISTFGKIHVLVNNAGVNTSHILVADMPTKTFDRTIKTNLYGPFFCSRKFAGHLREQNIKGKIINVSSVHEDIAVAGGADYNASKGGLKNFAKTLAIELAAEGTTVNNIAPGMILTPMNKAAMESREVREEASSHIPLNRPGKPEEVAKVALFLASADSDYVTGATYFIDGGLSLNVGQGA